MTKKEKILKWLSDNNVYYKFNDNFKRKDYIPLLAPDDEFIENAFSFDSTPEGEVFWKEINDQYKLWYHREFDDDGDYISPDDFGTMKRFMFYCFKNSLSDHPDITVRAPTLKEAIDFFHKEFPDLYYFNIRIV